MFFLNKTEDLKQKRPKHCAQSSPPSYQKPAINWVMSAKQEATQLKRLAELMTDSEAGLRIKILRR
jgi:hypothetical protein